MLAKTLGTHVDTSNTSETRLTVHLKAKISHEPHERGVFARSRHLHFSRVDREQRQVAHLRLVNT